jgi:membrane-associated phospholipid phosphatase
MVATIYLGWHFFVDVLAGIAVGAAAVVLGARATGNPVRRREEPWTFRAALGAAVDSARDGRPFELLAAQEDSGRG